MPKINWNQVAIKIARMEGKKKQVDIAQIKEILGDLAEVLLLEYNSWDVLEGIVRLGSHKCSKK